MHAAFEWDHTIGRSFVQWLVMECAGIGEKFGGIQAFPPRRDIAYFVDESTAKDDARIFAAWKNGEVEAAPERTGVADTGGYEAYQWDHEEGRPLVRWAVLRWAGSVGGARQDVAYFLDERSAEQDALAFARLMNRGVAG